MKDLANSLQQNISLFSNAEQALLYSTLLHEGPLGAEKLHQLIELHRETIQRELKKMEKIGTITWVKNGRNKKAQAISVSTLQEIIENKRDNFITLLKPLLEAESHNKKPKVSIYINNHNFGLLQLKLIKSQPKSHDIRVISTHPKEWIETMIQSKKLSLFENIRIKKEIKFLLSCFSEFRGQVEYNNREYFAGQPEKLKRQYRYIESADSSPLQIQIWFNHIVISIFGSTPSIHISIEDPRVVQAMKAYFNILWNFGER